MGNTRTKCIPSVQPLPTECGTTELDCAQYRRKVVSVSYSLAGSALLAFTLIVSGFTPCIAEDDMPMGGQSMASPQSAAVPTQVDSMSGQRMPNAQHMMMPMGQSNSQQPGAMGGGMQNMDNEMQPIAKTKGMKLSIDMQMKMNRTRTLKAQKHRRNKNTISNRMAPMGQQGQSAQMSDQELKKEFRQADKNYDGSIDLNEVVVHESGDKIRAKQHFDDADRNKDGKIDEAEWLRHHKESPLQTNKDGAK